MTYYFYDLETSGFSAKNDRIVQFAGQRTSMDLNPVGKAENILIKMTPDVLPEPGAMLVHGISPQKTLTEGISEAEFCQYLTKQIFSPNTITVGFNSIRFDNQFIRFILWRNFHDAYEWSYKNDRSVWDLLDLVRMTRALRPEGIKWPFAPDGQPTNSLQYLTAVNKLNHADSHDAVGDVMATIELARLLKSKQPKLFDYLLNIRGKDKVRPLVSMGKPLIYTSGRYLSEFEKTTIAVMIVERADKSSALMYDLRIDPYELKDLSPVELAKRWQAWNKRDEEAAYFPVKELKYNQSPAVAPLSTLDEATASRLKIRRQIIDSHFNKLQRSRGFGKKLLEALEIMWPARKAELVIDEQKVDAQLYDGFIDGDDKTKMSVVRAAKPEELPKLDLNFKDGRLNALLPLYKARNYPQTLTQEEKKAWENFRRQKLVTGGRASSAGRFFAQIEELSKTVGLSTGKQSLLEDLRDYAKSVLPVQ